MSPTDSKAGATKLSANSGPAWPNSTPMIVSAALFSALGAKSSPVVSNLARTYATEFARVRESLTLLAAGIFVPLVSLGFDLKAEGFDQLKDTMKERERAPASKDQTTPSASSFISGTKKPVVVAIQGAAVGMGITLPCLCDIRVAYEDAKIGFVFTRR